MLRPAFLLPLSGLLTPRFGTEDLSSLRRPATRRSDAYRVLFACSSSATAPKPPPGPGSGGPTQVRPLAFGADAKRGDSALILGTDGAGGSTVVPLAAGERKVSVDSLYVITGAGTATGGLGAVELTAATSSAGQVRIGIFEDVSGGSARAGAPASGPRRWSPPTCSART
jgi:hypothetical protein